MAVTSTVWSRVGSAQDQVEFLDGNSLQGEILEIRKPAKEFDFRSTIGGQEVTQTYDYADVHAVVFKGKRFVLTPKPTEGAASGSERNVAVSRSRPEVLARIKTVGSQPPDWFDSTPLNHPQSLDLDWPLKPGGKWDESKNVGQYIWGKVNPNPARWQSGIKLVHDCMQRHQGDRELLVRDMEKLGTMYFTLLQDYERAAYWYQQAKVSIGTQSGVRLATCYWRLGNKRMALDKLRGGNVHMAAIKLYGDMGEIDSAVQLADRYAQSANFNEAFLAAADALRDAGRPDEAIAYYQQILDRNSARNAEYLKRYRGRAQDSIEAIRLFDKSDVTQVADGSYQDQATGYNGPLKVQVTVKGSKITDVQVTQHQEKQFYAALEDTPRQIIDRQGIHDIDGTSGATITSEAIISATARALAQGVR